MHIGLKIKKLRKERGMSQTKLSELIKMDNSQLSKVENGKLTPTIEQIVAISSIFNVSADWLMDKNDSNNINQKVKGNNNVVTGQNRTQEYKDGNKDDIVRNLQQQLSDYKNIVAEKDKQINKLLELINKLS